jgi:D-lactate dehydrogenase
LRSLERDWEYDALETCAADGLCALACPVAIDTGKLTKRLRREAHADAAQELASFVAGRFGLVERAARAALRVGRFAPGAASLVRRLAGHHVSTDELPRAARGFVARGRRQGAVAVCFPSCVSRVLGEPDGDGPSMTEAMLAVCERAGLPLWIPGGVAGLCCGMPFSSKGYDGAYRRAAGATLAALLEWTGGGELPVVVDSSPCAQTLKLACTDLPSSGREGFERLTILDGIELAHDRVLPKLSPRRRSGPVVLHPVCSVQKMELEAELQAVAAAYAESVEVPIAAGCCGFAGDRGFTVPELTAAALRDEADEVRRVSWAGYYSSSRTCEIGLTRATGKPYRSFWHLLEKATR